VSAPAEGTLAVNVMYFARTLRGAGMLIGPGAVVDALLALSVLDLSHRDDMKACLRAVFVHRREDLELFDQAFALFFRDPLGMEQILSLLLPKTGVAAPAPTSEMSRRLAEALHPGGPRPEERPSEKVEIEATLAYSAREALRTKDFAAMSAEELREAREIIRSMPLTLERFPTRRSRPDPRGPRVDGRATLRAALRGGGHDIPLRRRQARERTPPLVVLCDISGSMGRYTEMLVRFSHVLVNERERVSCFLFGTRLSNVTRALRRRDVDVALGACAREVSDWAGGTRIGACLDDFNRRWSRRVLGQGAIVLLVSDGLDRDDAAGLAEAAERLHKSCRRLIWLNPLLSFAGFAPRARGVRAILPHVDDFRPIHNLESLAQLAAALGPR
jgi:uncharacterized protein with von Willebrand factor type A (vWA) domain